MTGLDDRRSMLSRRVVGLRRPLRILAGLLLWLLSAALNITAKAQTTNDGVGSANTLWSVPGIRMNDVMRSADGTIFVLTKVAEKRDITIFEEAIAAIKRRDCKGAWDLVWPLAKAGDQSARHFLYAWLVGKMLLPGVTRDHAMYFRHYLTLGAYAAITPDKQLTFRGDPERRAVRGDILSSLHRMKLGRDGDRVTQCYATTVSFKKCLDLAVSLGVISRFEDYARDTEQAERETGAAAQCLPPI